MQLASLRIITDDLDRLTDFYELVTGLKAERPAPAFAEFVLAGATLDIVHSDTVARLGAAAPRAAENHTVILEFRVDDVDVEFARLETLVDTWVLEPTTMPWGNRSTLLRDPDGNLVNLFAPVTEEAIRRLSGRG